MNTCFSTYIYFMIVCVLCHFDWCKDYKNDYVVKDYFKGFKGPAFNPREWQNPPQNPFKKTDNISNPFEMNFNPNQFKRRNRVGINQTSPIASVVIPDIQPVLDIIIAGAADIYAQVNALLNTTLIEIQIVINADFAVAIPLVKSVIDTGNATLEQDFVVAFNTANTNITNDFQAITTQENIDASQNIVQNNAALLASIIAVLNQVQADVSIAVNAGLTASADAVIAALTVANNSLYTQISTLLADPNNTQPILPQLVYADSVVISNLLVDTNNGVYQAIVALLNAAWIQIQDLINASVGTGVAAQTLTLNAANEALLTSLNTNISALLVSVQQSITTVTAFEVTEINLIIGNLAPTLITDIEGVLNGLEAEITTIINTVTASCVTATVNLITANNNSVLNAVITILATN